MGRAYIKSSEFNLVQLAVLIFFMHKYHKYKSKWYNESSLAFLITPKGISLLWPTPLTTVHPCPCCAQYIFFFLQIMWLWSLESVCESLHHSYATMRWLTERAKCQIKSSKLGVTVPTESFLCWLGWEREERGREGEEKGSCQRAAGHESATTVPVSTGTLVVSNPTLHVI